MNDASIIGYTIEGVGPVDRVHLEHTPGLSLLYGLNGAGKTALIEGIRLGLQGVRGGAAIHLHVPDPFEWAEQFDVRLALLWAGTEAMDDAPKELGGRRPPWDPYEWRAPHDAAQQFASAGEYFRDEAILGKAVQGLIDWELSEEQSDDDLRTRFATEVAEQGLFVLTPVGTPTQPMWRVEIAVRVGAGQELVDQYINYHLRTTASDRYEASAERLDALLHGRSTVPVPVGHELDLGGLGDDERADVIRPAWAGFPVVYFGVVTPSEAWPPAVLTDEHDQPLDDIHRYLAGGDGGLLDMSDAKEVVLRDDVQTRVAKLNERVNDTLASLVESPPVLSLHVEHPNRIYAGAPPFAWRATDGASLSEVALDSLSEYQLRWARFAIGLSLSSLGPSGAVLLVDEPERAAHPQSIERLGAGLRDVARRVDADVIASTHAPQLLDETGGRLLHVRRNDLGHSVVHPLDLTSWGDTDRARRELGLSPSDLLQATRVFVVVEGSHDEVVIGTLVGDELRRIGARMLVMRGTRNLPSLLDSQFLLSFTDANFIVVVDNASAGRIERFTRALTTEHGAQRHKSLDALRSGSSEEKSVAELLSEAHRHGQLERVSVFGLKKRDIIRYLPVNDFHEEASSWSDLDRVRDRSVELKQWLRQSGASVSRASIARSAARMDSIPAEFNKLVDVCADFAKEQHVRSRRGDIV